MTTDEVLTRLAERGLALPDAPAPAGSYVPLRIHGEVGYLAGQFPIVDGKPAVTGRVGAERTLEEGRRAAEISALNVLGSSTSLTPSRSESRRGSKRFAAPDSLKLVGVVTGGRRFESCRGRQPIPRTRKLLGRPLRLRSTAEEGRFGRVLLNLIRYRRVEGETSRCETSVLW